MSTDDKGARAESFGQVADLYQRARPGYPPEAIEWALGPKPLEVLDLGAGTGKLTAALLAAGHRVTALEPLEEMRAVLAANLPAATAIGGRAEDLPLPDASFDAVVAGSAFHWFDHEQALAEVARVLRPPGVFGLLGNRGAPIYRADRKAELARSDEFWATDPELQGRERATLRWRTPVRRNRGLLTA